MAVLRESILQDIQEKQKAAAAAAANVRKGTGEIYADTAS